MDWSHRWQMNFNTDKWKVLCIGCKNKKANYNMNSIKLQMVNEGKDLGIIISSDLKPSRQ